MSQSCGLISVCLFLNLVYKVRVNEAHPTFEQSGEPLATALLGFSKGTLGCAESNRSGLICIAITSFNWPR